MTSTPTTTPAHHPLHVDQNKRQKKFVCPCNLTWCSDGTIIRLIEANNVGDCDLLKIRSIPYIEAPSSHNERKLFALRKCAEFHLGIKPSKKRYEIFKYHWPLPIIRRIGRLNANERNYKLFNAEAIKEMEDEQRDEFGISVLPLLDNRNKYGTLLSTLSLSRSVFSALELGDHECYVQAPTACKDDINAYLLPLSSTRSARLNKRRVNNNAIKPIDIATATSPEAAAINTMPETSDADASSSMGISNSPWSQPAVEDNVTHVFSTPSPLASRSLFSSSMESPDMIPKPKELVSMLQDKFARYLASERTIAEFQNNFQVNACTHNMVMVFKESQPIMLSSDPCYWLFPCRDCGTVAYIGKKESTNKHLCHACRSRDTRRANQIADAERLSSLSSRAPITSLCTPVLKLHYANVRRVLTLEQQRNARLQRALLLLKKKEKFTIDSGDTETLSKLEDEAEYVAKDPQKISDLIVSVITKLTCRNGKDNDIVGQAGMEEFADHIVTEITNFGKVIAGKKTQVRFSPRVLRLALSLWMRSKKGYEVTRDQSLTIMPSHKRLEALQRQMKVNEGKCAKIYGWFHDTYVSASKKVRHGQLMCDEMKLKEDIYWNCSDHSMVGLAESRDGTSEIYVEDEIAKLFEEAFAEYDHDDPESELTTNSSTSKINEDDSFNKPATYVNLWRLRTTLNCTQSGEFFFNSGSLSGVELLRQLLRVMGHYEMIGVQIMGVLCDAAGQNAKLFSLLCDGKRIPPNGYLKDEFVRKRTRVAKPEIKQRS